MIFYEKRSEAEREKLSYERVVKVDGGYMVMTEDEYQVWKNQK